MRFGTELGVEFLAWIVSRYGIWIFFFVVVVVVVGTFVVVVGREE